jgi:hypothetical protein
MAVTNWPGRILGWQQYCHFRGKIYLIHQSQLALALIGRGVPLAGGKDGCLDAWMGIQLIGGGNVVGF